MRSGVLVNARLSATNFLLEATLISKAGCLLLCIFFLLSFLVNVQDVIAITPGHLIPPNFWIWTLVTHQFVETSFLQLALNCFVLLFSVKVLESLWGSTGFLLFFSIVTASTGLLTFFVYLFIYVSTFDISYLFDVHIYGLHAYTSAVLVCLKQSRGDQMVIGSVGLNIKNLPFVYCAFLVIFKLANLISGSTVALSLNGILVAWVYLRFYQSHSKGRGDQASHFAFKTFFPKPVQGPVGVLSNALYKVLLALKICRKTSYRYDVGAPSKFTITLSGVDALDAERRRNKAIKALDERLQKQDEPTNEWPLLDGAEETSSEVVVQMPSASSDESSTGGSGGVGEVAVKTEAVVSSVKIDLEAVSSPVIHT